MKTVHRQLSLHNSSGGTGLIETLIAVTILLVVAIGIGSWISKSSLFASKLSSKSECSQLASSLVEGIKNQDNALAIRTFFPSGLSDLRAPSNTLDPYCNGLSTRSRLCDIPGLIEPGVVAIDQVRTSLNVRGAMTWAMNFINSFQPAACGGEVTFTKQTLNEFWELLPVGGETPPSWVQELKVSVTPMSIGGTVPTSCPNGLRLTPSDAVGLHYIVEVKYIEKGTDGASASQICRAETMVGFPQDSTPPIIDSIRITNGASDVLGDGACTCQEIWQNGDTPATMTAKCDAEMYDVHADVQTSEPGTLPVCNQRSPGSSTGFHYCGSFFSVSGLSPAGTVENFQINAKGRPDLYIGLRGEDGKTFAFDVKSYDVGQNESNVRSFDFIVKQPFCPVRNSYCPGEIRVDGCGRNCPSGGKPSDCSGCGGTDSCGRACPPCPPPDPGPPPRPAPQEPGEPGCGVCKDPSQVPCNQTVTDDCGNNCQTTGNQNCPPSEYCQGAALWPTQQQCEDNPPPNPNLVCMQVYNGCWVWKCPVSPVCCVCNCTDGVPMANCD